jgi:hypothetical protein
MTVHSTGRLTLFRLILLVFIPVLYFQCGGGTPQREVTCPPANARRYKPTIEVDETQLKASPRVAIVWDVEPVDPNTPPFKPSNKPVKITWQTKNRFNLVVTFNDPNCGIEPPHCNGQGQCTAMVKKAQQNTRCTYQMFDGNNLPKKDEDADIIVTPCCW